MFSWWSSIQSVNTFIAWMNYAMAFFGVLTAIAIILSAVATRHVGALQDDITGNLNRQLTDTQTALQGTRDELRRTQAELEQARKPRSLSTGQRAAFIAALRAGPRGRVNVDPIANDDEANTFAGIILSALQEAGWDAQSTGALMMPHGAKGLVVLVWDQNHVPDHAHALANAFKRIGFPVTGEQDQRWSRREGEIILVVGRKP